MTKFFVLDRPCVDYLTATSFSQELVDRATDSLLPSMVKEFSWDEQLSPAKLMQYKGFQATDFRGKQVAFTGKGLQKQQDHFLFRASGGSADFAYRKLLASDFDYTLSRLDLQLSCISKVEANARLWKSFNESQNELEQEKGARGRKVLLYTDNGDGNTLYVGSRQSVKFIRCYQKSESTYGKEKESSNKQSTSLEHRSCTSEACAGEAFVRTSSGQEPVRLEIELKHDAAKTFHRQAKKFGLEISLHSALEECIQGLVSTPLLKPHRDIIKAFPEVQLWKEPLLRPTLDKTLIWFGQCCLNSAIRMLQGKETQEEAGYLIVALVENALPFLSSGPTKRLEKVVAENKKLKLERT